MVKMTLYTANTTKPGHPKAAFLLSPVACAQTQAGPTRNRPAGQGCLQNGNLCLRNKPWSVLQEYTDVLPAKEREATEACGCGWRRGRKCGWPHTGLQAADNSRRASLYSTYCGFGTHPVTLLTLFLSLVFTSSPLPHGTNVSYPYAFPRRDPDKRTQQGGEHRWLCLDARDQHRA